MDEDDALERVTQVEASASRKIQLDEYEPIETFVSLTAEVQDGDDVGELEASLSDVAMERAERAAMERHEEFVREEAFGED